MGHQVCHAVIFTLFISTLKLKDSADTTEQLSTKNYHVIRQVAMQHNQCTAISLNGEWGAINEPIKT
jgi:hypothetical protein